MQGLAPRLAVQAQPAVSGNPLASLASPAAAEAAVKKVAAGIAANLPVKPSYHAKRREASEGSSSASTGSPAASDSSGRTSLSDAVSRGSGGGGAGAPSSPPLAEYPSTDEEGSCGEQSGSEGPAAATRSPEGGAPPSGRQRQQQQEATARRPAQISVSATNLDTKLQRSTRPHQPSRNRQGTEPAYHVARPLILRHVDPLYSPRARFVVVKIHEALKMSVGGKSCIIRLEVGRRKH